MAYPYGPTPSGQKRGYPYDTGADETSSTVSAPVDPLADIERTKANARRLLAAKGVPDPTVRPAKVGVLNRIFGPLQAPGAVIRGLLHNALNPVEDTDVDIGKVAWETFQGKDEATAGANILREHFGVKNPWAQMIGGAAIDIVSDPVTYVTLGYGSLTKATAITKVTSLFGDNVLTAAKVLEIAGNNADDAARVIAKWGQYSDDFARALSKGKDVADSGAFLTKALEKGVKLQDLPKQMAVRVQNDLFRLATKGAATGLDKGGLAFRIPFTGGRRVSVLPQLQGLFDEASEGTKAFLRKVPGARAIEPTFQVTGKIGRTGRVVEALTMKRMMSGYTVALNTAGEEAELLATKIAKDFTPELRNLMGLATDEAMSYQAKKQFRTMLRKLAGLERKRDKALLAVQRLAEQKVPMDELAGPYAALKQAMLNEGGYRLETQRFVTDNLSWDNIESYMKALAPQWNISDAEIDAAMATMREIREVHAKAQTAKRGFGLMEEQLYREPFVLPGDKAARKTAASVRGGMKPMRDAIKAREDEIRQVVPDVGKQLEAKDALEEALLLEQKAREVWREAFTPPKVRAGHVRQRKGLSYKQELAERAMDARMSSELEAAVTYNTQAAVENSAPLLALADEARAHVRAMGYDVPEGITADDLVAAYSEIAAKTERDVGEVLNFRYHERWPKDFTKDAFFGDLMEPAVPASAVQLAAASDARRTMGWVRESRRTFSKAKQVVESVFDWGPAKRPAGRAVVEWSSNDALFTVRVVKRPEGVEDAADFVDDVVRELRSHAAVEDIVVVGLDKKGKEALKMAGFAEARKAGGMVQRGFQSESWRKMVDAYNELEDLGALVHGTPKKHLTNAGTFRPLPTSALVERTAAPAGVGVEPIARPSALPRNATATSKAAWEAPGDWYEYRAEGVVARVQVLGDRAHIYPQQGKGAGKSVYFIKKPEGLHDIVARIRQDHPQVTTIGTDRKMAGLTPTDMPQAPLIRGASRQPPAVRYDAPIEVFDAGLAKRTKKRVEVPAADPDLDELLPKVDEAGSPITKVQAKDEAQRLVFAIDAATTPEELADAVQKVKDYIGRAEDLRSAGYVYHAPQTPQTMWEHARAAAGTPTAEYKAQREVQEAGLVRELIGRGMDPEQAATEAKRALDEAAAVARSKSVFAKGVSPKQPKQRVWQFWDWMTEGVPVETDIAVATGAKMRQDAVDIAKANFQADVARSFGRQLKGSQTARTGYKGINVTRFGKTRRYEIPMYVADTMDDIARAFADEEVTSAWLGAADWAQGWFKKMATSANPGFHLRNLRSNIFLMWREDGLSADGLRDGYNLLGLSMTKGKSAKELAEMTVDMGTAGTMSGTEALAFMQKHGVTREMFGRGEMGRELRRALRGPKISVTRTGAKVGQFVEDGSRAATFLTYLRRGVDVDTAAQMVSKALFDYMPESLSFAERQIGRRMFPFYIWLRNALPAMVETTLKNPGKIGWIRHLQQNAQAAFPVDQSLYPDYLRQLYPIPVGKDAEGNALLLTPNDPSQELEKLNLEPRDAFSAISPFKLLVELGANYDFYYGEQIVPPGGLKKRAPGALQGLDAVAGQNKWWATLKPLLGLETYKDRSGQGYLAIDARVPKILSGVSPWFWNLNKALDDQPKTPYDRLSWLGGVRFVPFDIEQAKLSQGYDDLTLLEGATKRARRLVGPAGRGDPPGTSRTGMIYTGRLPRVVERQAEQVGQVIVRNRNARATARAEAVARQNAGRTTSALEPRFAAAEHRVLRQRSALSAGGSENIAERDWFADSKAARERLFPKIKDWRYGSPAEQAQMHEQFVINGPARADRFTKYVSTMHPPYVVLHNIGGPGGPTLKLYPDQLGDRAVLNALPWVGAVPYKWGSRDPSVGLDCSGVPIAAYRMLGVDVGAASSEIEDRGANVMGQPPAPGDVYVYHSDSSPSGHHSRMFAGTNPDTGAPTWVESGGPQGGGVHLSERGRTPVAVRRFMGKVPAGTPTSSATGAGGGATGGGGTGGGGGGGGAWSSSESAAATVPTVDARAELGAKYPTELLWQGGTYDDLLAMLSGKQGLDLFPMPGRR